MTDGSDFDELILQNVRAHFGEAHEGQMSYHIISNYLLGNLRKIIVYRNV
jgi:hypothetical protein